MGQFGRSGAAREVGLGAVVTGTWAGPAARNGIGYLAAMNCRLTRRARKWPCLAHKRPPRHPYPLICGCALWAACRVRGRVWVSSRASIHRCESLTFSLWRLTGAVNGGRDAARDQAPPEWRGLVCDSCGHPHVAAGCGRKPKAVRRAGQPSIPVRVRRSAGLPSRNQLSGV